VRKPHLPNSGLVDEILPGGNALQGHEVIDVLDCVLETCHIKLNSDSRTT